MTGKKAIVNLGTLAESTVIGFKRSMPWTGNYDERMDKFKRFLESMSSAYDVETPELQIADPDARRRRRNGIPAVGEYIGGTIRIRRFSVLTLLHEFRHHLQASWNGIRLLSRNKEEDAEAWSQAVFKKFFPKNFNRLRQQGKLNRTVIEI